VDNEAESPGYTTVPEEFPGRRETLELIRLVGNLTINVADTHDYWTPGPPQALSYYPNLFLYPAYGGRYTCVGRMFLSTEDRPRLGMKTLVLDTSQLVASGEFGPSVLRWYATMAGGRAESRKPPVPDPAMYGIVGEGLLFYRGSTEPVVIAASNEWDAAMEVVFELIRVFPASLLMLGAILAFPYFLPQPKTNLHEFTEQVPLALSLMRIPMAEAMGDRHKKRIQSWESTNLTFRDLTSGLPATSKGRENIPQVLQYVRDRNAPRLAPIVQRVDLVEVPKLRAVLNDPERQGGKERRKEMWRIGTAMESAALLLQRGRGRHVPVSVETARRAQEYLRAELPHDEPEPTADTPMAASAEAALATNGHPSWLAKGADLPAPARAGPEIVPVSVSEDPSILPAGATARTPSSPTSPSFSTPSAPGPVPPAAPASPSFPAAANLGVDAGSLERVIDAALTRSLGGRLPQLEEEMLRRLAGEIEQAVGGEVERRLDAAVETRVRTLLQLTETRLAQTLTSQDTRWQEKFRQFAASTNPSPEWRAQFDADLAQRIATISAASERAVTEATRKLEGQITSVENRLGTQVTGMLAGTEARLRESLPTTLGTEIDRRLRSQIDRELAEPASGEKGLIAARIDNRIDEAVRLQMQGAGTKFSESIGELESRINERLLQFQSASSPLSSKTLESVQPLIDRRVVEALEGQRRGLEELIRDLANREEGERASLSAQLQADFTALLAQETEARAVAADGLLAQMESRLQEAEARLASETGALESRIAALIDGRAKDTLGAAMAADRELASRVAGAEERSTKGISELEGRVQTLLEARMREALARAATGQKEVDARFADAEARRARDERDLETRLTALLESRAKEALARAPAGAKELETRLRTVAEERVAQLEARLTKTLDERMEETRELQTHADADLQVRLQSYTDQKLREAEDHVRTTTVELLGRLRGDVEGSLARLPDATRIEAALRERSQRSTEALRSELQLTVEQKISEAEDRVRRSQGTDLAKLEALERGIQTHTQELVKVEASMRAELDDLDGRLVTLSDRLLPVVRKTWLRVAELEKGPVGAGAADLEPRIAQLRRDVKEDIRRFDQDVTERLRDMRDRLETTIAHQGKVWLTLIRQLSSITEGRRSIEETQFPPLAAGPALPPEPSGDDEESEPETPSRRRLRRAGRGVGFR
jgi:hypothetical protein